MSNKVNTEYKDGETSDALTPAKAKEGAKGPLVLISVEKELRYRIPKIYSKMPRWSIKLLERIIHQKEMNNLIRRHHGKRDAEFARAVIDDLNINFEVKAPEGLPDPNNHRVVIVSNHPLGGIDGLTMIDYFTRYYNCHVNVMVNDILSNIDPLSGVFMPVNCIGPQNHRYQERVKSAFEGDDPIIIFPAGTVSRKKGGVITDVEWKRAFLSWSLRTGRTIIPAYFDGRNSKRFYRAYKLRKLLRLKWSVEMVFLPGEIFRGAGNTYSMTLGSEIPTAELKHMKADEMVATIRKIVYSLAENP